MAPVGCSVQELSAQLLSLLFFLPWQWQKWHQVDVSRPLNLMWWQWMRYYPQDWRLCGWVNIWIHPTTHFLFIYHFYLYHFAALHPLSLSLSHIDTHTRLRKGQWSQWGLGLGGNSGHTHFIPSNLTDLLFLQPSHWSCESAFGFWSEW